jgi:Icc protein
LQLVQLSDLHIGGAYFKQEIFDTIVSEVNNELKLDVILITGDLTDEGLISQFKRASVEIKRRNTRNVLYLGDSENDNPAFRRSDI